MLILWTISDLLIGGVPAPSPADRYTTAALCPNGQYPVSSTSHQASRLHLYILLVFVRNGIIKYVVRDKKSDCLK